MAQLRKMCTEPCVIRARDVGKGTNVCDNWRHDRCSTKKQATAWPTMLLPLPSKAEEVRMSLPVAVRDAMEEDIVAEAANTLQLDARQRAMLQEMGVRLWLPPSEPEVEAAVEVGVGAMAAATPAKADAATAIQHTPAQAVEQAFDTTEQKQQPPQNTQ